MSEANKMNPIAGETDWKLIAVDVTDPLAEKLNGTIFDFTSISMHTPCTHDY